MTKLWTGQLQQRYGSQYLKPLETTIGGERRFGLSATFLEFEYTGNTNVWLYIGIIPIAKHVLDKRYYAIGDTIRMHWDVSVVVDKDEVSL